MKMEKIFTGKSVGECKEKAAEEFGVDLNLINFTVLNDVKKGLFGKIKEEAKIKAVYEKEDTAEIKHEEIPSESGSETKETVPEENNEVEETVKNYLEKILRLMNVQGGIEVKSDSSGINVEIDSSGSGFIIGRRGETLDALQYLTSLVANQGRGEYRRVTLDSCGYRKKREETLKNLAKKIGEKALKTGRSTTLEPMNPYERRIIHSTISEIEGVSSRSVGEEPYRKIIISPDNPRKRNSGRKDAVKKRTEPRSLDLKTSFEKDYKRPKPEDDIHAGLYGKIEL